MLSLIYYCSFEWLKTHRPALLKAVNFSEIFKSSRPPIFGDTICIRSRKKSTIHLAWPFKKAFLSKCTGGGWFSMKLWPINTELYDKKVILMIKEVVRWALAFRGDIGSRWHLKCKTIACYFKNIYRIPLFLQEQPSCGQELCNKKY